jgi:hypothetical protein
MGAYVTVKLDYFLTIKPQARNFQELKIKCANGHDRDRSSDAAFCTQCGEKFAPVTVEVTKSVDYFQGFIQDIPELEAFDGLAWAPAYRANNTFFVIDITTTEKKAEDLDINRGFVVTDIEKPPMSWTAEQTMTDFITKFKRVYGEDSIKLEYGLYSYCN